MKPLHKVLSDLNACYASLDNITKWMNSKVGHKFADRLGFEPLDQLIERFHAPRVKVSDYEHRLNCYKYGAKMNKLVRRTIIVKDYDKKLEEMKKEGKLKLPPSLTKAERMAIETEIIRDENGKPIQKTDKQGRKFWNSVTNKPIPVRKRKSTKMGTAKKCHMYELHKMAKWDRKNPEPTQSALLTDLFPLELMAAHRTRRSLAVERVRNELAELYCHATVKRPLLRMYEVHSKIGYGGQDVVYENECDPYIFGYPFSSYNSFPSLPSIEDKLRCAIKKRENDPSLVAIKVYDMYGNVRGELRAA